MPLFFSRPPTSRVADEAEPFPGKASIASSRDLSPALQFNLARRVIVQGYDLPPDPGSVQIRGQRQLSVTQFIRNVPPRVARQEDGPSYPGVILRAGARISTSPPPPPGQKPPTTAGQHAQELPAQPGSAIYRSGLTGVARIDLARPQQIASGVDLALHPGVTITSSGARFVNLRTAQRLTVDGLQIAPHPGSVSFHTAMPLAIPRTFTPSHVVTAQAEASSDPGSAIARRSAGQSSQFGCPPDALVVRAADPAPEAGSVSVRHGQGIVTPILPQRGVVARAGEPAPEAGQSIGRSATRSASYALATRAIVAAQEAPTEAGRVFADVNMGPPVPNRVVSAMITQAEQIIHPGVVIQAIGKRVSSPLTFARPARGVVVGVEQPAPEAGSIHYWIGTFPPLNESYAMVDPDLATLIIVANPDLASVDPDLATEVISE